MTALDILLKINLYQGYIYLFIYFLLLKENYTSLFSWTKGADVQLNRSGGRHPGKLLSHNLVAFPEDPAGHGTVTGVPYSAFSHQMPRL